MVQPKTVKELFVEGKSEFDAANHEWVQHKRSDAAFDNAFSDENMARAAKFLDSAPKILELQKNS